MSQPLRLPVDEPVSSAATVMPLRLLADSAAQRPVRPSGRSVGPSSNLSQYLADTFIPPSRSAFDIRPELANKPLPSMSDQIVGAAGRVADVVLSVGDIGAGTLRYLARALPSAMANMVAPGAGTPQYVPLTANELEDAGRAQTGLALGASYAVGGIAGGLLGTAYAAGAGAAGITAAEATSAANVVMRSLPQVIRSLGAATSAGAAFGTVRPTRPDESRLSAVQNDALGFALWDAGILALVHGGAAANALIPNPSLRGAGEAFTPDGVGPIITGTPHVQEALQAGLGPSRAADVLAGRWTLQEAWMDRVAGRLRAAGTEAERSGIQQEMERGLAASQQVVQQHGFTWLADGRPVAQWPVNAGETFVARSMKNGTVAVRLANQLNQPKAFTVGSTLEDALNVGRPLRQTTSIPDANVTDFGVGVGMTPLNRPPSPEYQGFFGGIRWLSENFLRNRFAAVQAFDEGMGSTFNNHAATNMTSGYNSLLWSRLTGIEDLTETQRTLLGKYTVDRELRRTRSLIQSHIDEATEALQSGADDALRWQQQLEQGQTALTRVRQPYLSPAENAQVVNTTVLNHVVRELDTRLQPWLEDHKYMAGLSTGALETYANQPVLSLIARPALPEGIQGTEAEAGALGAARAGALPAGTAGPVTSAYQVGKTVFSLPRTGAAAEYETDIGRQVEEWVREATTKNAKRNTFDYIVNAPWTRRIESRTLPNGRVVYDEVPEGYRRLPLESYDLPGIDTASMRLAVPKVVADAFEDLAIRSRSMRLNPLAKPYTEFMDAMTGLQLTSPNEATAHAWRLTSMYSRLPGAGGDSMIAKLALAFPSLGPKGTAIADMVNTTRDPLAFADDVRTLARVGALTGRPLEETAQNLLMRSLNGVFDLDAIRRGVFGFSGIETRTRVAGLRWLRQRTLEATGRAPTDAEIRDSVNGWGTYGQEMQTGLLSWLRKSRVVAFGSFSLGGALGSEIEQFLGPFLPNMKGGTRLPASVWNDIPLARQMAMRAEVMWRGLVGDMAVRAAITKMNSGYWPWQAVHRDTGHLTDIAVGKQGDGPDERVIYAGGNALDPALTRAYRTSMMRALAVGTATGLATQGPWSQRFQTMVQESFSNMRTDALNTFSNLVSPGLRMASIAATGTTTHFVEGGTGLEPMRVSAPEYSRGRQLLTDAITAVTLGNPITSQLLEGRATRNIESPLGRAGAAAANLMAPGGIRLGPPRAVWEQLARQRVTTRYSAVVNRQASDIIDAPNAAEYDRRLNEAQARIQEQVPEEDQGMVLGELGRVLRSRPRARARRAAALR